MAVDPAYLKRLEIYVLIFGPPVVVALVLILGSQFAILGTVVPFGIGLLRLIKARVGDTPSSRQRLDEIHDLLKETNARIDKIERRAENAVTEEEVQADLEELREEIQDDHEPGQSRQVDDSEEHDASQSDDVVDESNWDSEGETGTEGERLRE